LGKEEKVTWGKSTGAGGTKEVVASPCPNLFEGIVLRSITTDKGGKRKEKEGSRKRKKEGFRPKLLDKRNSSFVTCLPDDREGGEGEREIDPGDGQREREGGRGKKFCIGRKAQDGIFILIKGDRTELRKKKKEEEGKERRL